MEWGNLSIYFFIITKVHRSRTFWPKASTVETVLTWRLDTEFQILNRLPFIFIDCSDFIYFFPSNSTNQSTKFFWFLSFINWSISLKWLFVFCCFHPWKVSQSLFLSHQTHKYWCRQHLFWNRSTTGLDFHRTFTIFTYWVIVISPIGLLVNWLRHHGLYWHHFFSLPPIASIYPFKMWFTPKLSDPS